MTLQDRQLQATSILAILVMLVVSTAGADEPKRELLFADSFDEELGEGWSWVREKPGHWRIRDGGLEVRPEPTVVRSATNLLTRPWPAGDSVAEVTVSNDPTEQYEQIGLVWYVNDGRMVKLVKEVVDGKTWIIMGAAVPGGGLKGKLPFETTSAAQLRLEVSGDTLTGSYREPGNESWTEVGSVQLPPGEKAYVSLQCYHGPKETERWHRFDDFRLFRH